MIKVKINGQEQNWDGDPDLSLLWFIRDEAGLTGTKFGCGQALCGSCTVIVDKQAVRACITSVSDVVGRDVTTIEGLHPTGDHAVQKAWRQVNVLRAYRMYRQRIGSRNDRLDAGHRGQHQHAARASVPADRGRRRQPVDRHPHPGRLPRRDRPAPARRPGPGQGRPERPLAADDRPRRVGEPERHQGFNLDGASRDRTGDLLLAKQALSQLSYGP